LPVGLLSLATVLNEGGRHKASVLDFNYMHAANPGLFGGNLDECIQRSVDRILDYAPGFVSIYSMCSTHCYAILLAEEIKSREPGVIVALGGPHASVTAAETLAVCPSIDLIGLGEGEMQISRIVTAFEEANPAACNGIMYRAGDEIVAAPPGELAEDLDSLPLLDYSLVNYDITGTWNMNIEVGRGCPYGCTFCSTSRFWQRRCRVKSAERIYQEMLMLSREYNICSFRFVHDQFVTNRHNVSDLCDMIVKGGHDWKWGCNARIDTVDRALLEKMAAAGCRTILFGIETGSAAMQKKIRKNIDLNIINTILPILRELNLRVFFTFIYGYPSETEEDVTQTLDLIHKLYGYFSKDRNRIQMFITLNKLSVFPGTPIYEEIKDELNANGRPASELNPASWNHARLNQVIGNRNIFPHYYDLDNEMSRAYDGLKVYYQYICRALVNYFEGTYRLLKEEFTTYNQIYFSFSRFFGEEIYTLENQTYANKLAFVYFCLEMFKKYIDNAYFSQYQAQIKEMFRFEYTLFKSMARAV